MIISLTNGLHFAVCLSVLDTQITSKHGQMKKVDCEAKYCEGDRFSKVMMEYRVYKRDT